MKEVTTSNRSTKPINEGSGRKGKEKASKKMGHSGKEREGERELERNVDAKYKINK